MLTDAVAIVHRNRKDHVWKRTCSSTAIDVYTMELNFDMTRSLVITTLSLLCSTAFFCLFVLLSMTLLGLVQWSLVDRPQRGSFSRLAVLPFTKLGHVDLLLLNVCRCGRIYSRCHPRIETSHKNQTISSIARCWNWYKRVSIRVEP